MGPTTTPATQTLLFDAGLVSVVCSVAFGVLEVDDAALVALVGTVLEEPKLEDVLTLDADFRGQRKPTPAHWVGDLPLLDCVGAVLSAFTRPLILNPGDDICCEYGSSESK